MEHSIVANKYELLKQVGRGGTSIVYLATDLRLNKNWAVKEINKQSKIEGQDVSHTLLAEATLMKNLDHPALPRIVDIFEENDRYFIVMDYIEGETLKEVLDQHGPQDQEQVIAWGLELAAMLNYLHTLNPPIIYRDMKPANIILQPNGSLKLIDFGIARTYKENRGDDTTPLGTKGYAAPEQFRGKVGQSDARTDIYNLGVTLYELMTCHVPSEPPYELLPLRKINPAFSIGLEKIIQTATKPNPEERIQSAAAFTSALQHYKNLDEDYIRAQKKKLRKVTVPFLSGVIAIVLAIGLLIGNSCLTSNKYETLLVHTGDLQSRIRSLEKAVKIKPQEVTAYELLIQELSMEGLTETESQELLSVYNQAIRAVKESSAVYAEINYILGEGYLLNFVGETDQSLRNKLIMALPFFQAVVNGGNTDYANYHLAEAYVKLGDFYKVYIIGADSVFVKEAKPQEYKTLFSDAKEMMKLLDTEAENNNKLKITTYSLILGVVDSQRMNLATCMKEADVQGMVDVIEADIKQITTANADVKEETEVIVSFIKELHSKISASYKNKKKRGGM